MHNNRWGSRAGRTRPAEALRRLVGQGDEPLHCGRCRQDRPGSEGCERTRGAAGGADDPTCHFKRIGLEAGPLSQWLSGESDRTGGRCGQSSTKRSISCWCVRKMVMAKGLGDENCQAPRPEEGD